MAAGGSACTDPPRPDPAPAPSGIPRLSTALHVHWTGPDDPVSRPLAVVLDEPGGPLDRIVSDPDVTTFLNDRFHPWFLAPGSAEGLPAAPAVWFVDAKGCILGGPHRPESPEDWITAANDAVTADPDDTEPGPRLRFVAAGFDVPARHPIRGQCGIGGNPLKP